VFEHLDQAAGVEIGARHEVGQADDALPGQRQLAQRLAAGGGNRRRDGAGCCRWLWRSGQLVALLILREADQRVGRDSPSGVCGVPCCARYSGLASTYSGLELRARACKRRV
jgi:hypothetical protein